MRELLGKRISIDDQEALYRLTYQDDWLVLMRWADNMVEYLDKSLLDSGTVDTNELFKLKGRTEGSRALCGLLKDLKNHVRDEE